MTQLSLSPITRSRRCCRSARAHAAVEFYKAALGAVEVYRVEEGIPAESVVSRLSVDGAEFWVADESPEHAQNFSPESIGGGTVRMILTVPEPDAACAQGLAARRPRGRRCTRTPTAGASAASSTPSATTGRSVIRLPAPRSPIDETLSSYHRHDLRTRRRDVTCSPLFRGWRLVSPDLGFVAENALLGAIGLGLAVWAFRLTQTRKCRPTRPRMTGPAGCPASSRGRAQVLQVGEARALSCEGVDAMGLKAEAHLTA